MPAIEKRIRLLPWLLLPIVVIGIAGLLHLIGHPRPSGTPGPRPEDSPATLHLNGQSLRQTRERVKAGDPALAESLKLLRQAARACMPLEPDPVVNKSAPSPSGDPHDFVSLAYYYWPNPDTSNGLPYVSRDGRINPDNEGYDAVRLRKMSETVHTLALGAYLTGNSLWAEQAVRHLRAWFVDPDTRMNPHLRYAQMIRGKPGGSSFGIMDSWYLIETLDAEALLRSSSAWTDADHSAMQAWFRAYLEWLLGNEAGRKESLSSNNHGTWYDVQTVSYSLYAGDLKRARLILEAAKKARIRKQIRPMGSQPYELDRDASWDYVLFNLDGLTRLACLGDQVGVDLWNYRTEDGRSLKGAVDWLIPYVKNEKAWNYSQKPDKSNPLLLTVLYRSANRYGQTDYAELADAMHRNGDLNAWLAKTFGR